MTGATTEGWARCAHRVRATGRSPLPPHFPRTVARRTGDGAAMVGYGARQALDKREDS